MEESEKASTVKSYSQAIVAGKSISTKNEWSETVIEPKLSYTNRQIVEFYPQPFIW